MSRPGELMLSVRGYITLERFERSVSDLRRMIKNDVKNFKITRLTRAETSENLTLPMQPERAFAWQ